MDGPGHSPCSVMVGSGTCLHPAGVGGYSVHHDPVDGKRTNPGNREWGPSPLSFFVICPNPIHRVMVNWDPPISQVIHLPGPFQNGNTSISGDPDRSRRRTVARLLLLKHFFCPQEPGQRRHHYPRSRTFFSRAPGYGLSGRRSCK
jgi:hypothetical protein